MRVAVIVLGVLLCSEAIAGPQPWMKRENPETLVALVAVEASCPFSQTEAVETVNGVLIRSRLRPGNKDEFGFVVFTACVELAGGVFVYAVRTQFFKVVARRLLLETAPDYMVIGTAFRDSILQAMRETVEALVTDYLQANFDLAPE